MWAAVKSYVLRPFTFKISTAILSAISSLLLTGLLIYMKIPHWAMIAFFFSTTFVVIVGAIIEQFKVKHWILSYLAILSIVSSFMSFFLLQVSMLGSYTFAIVGWIIFALPSVINICYNLFKLSRWQQSKNPQGDKP